MDGKGAWRDNAFIERLPRTIKYEEVFLQAKSNVLEVRASIARYIYGFKKRHEAALERRKSKLNS